MIFFPLLGLIDVSHHAWQDNWLLSLFADGETKTGQ
jgi:hypothetical protein